MEITIELKSKKRSHGFSYSILGKTCTIFFEYFNEKVIKCHLIIRNDRNLNYLEFIGISKVNIEKGDNYSQSTGEDVALCKAIDKYIMYQDKYLERLNIKQEILNTRLDEGLRHKLQKIQSKNSSN